MTAEEGVHSMYSLLRIVTFLVLEILLSGSGKQVENLKNNTSAVFNIKIRVYIPI